ncbi:GWxTD domain-containing protein [candidate division KSB1 bacterium]|nr:GWxTD domain-containing protein [candidate division KSB1 bacterium]
MNFINKMRMVLFQMLLIFIIFSNQVLQGQSPPLQKHAIPLNVLLFNLAGENYEKSRLLLAMSVAQEKIQFTKDNSVYHAEFVISTEIQDKKGKSLALRDFTEKVELTNFSATVKSSHIKKWLGFFDLTPDKYIIKVKIFDVKSKLEGHFRREVELIDFTKGPIQSSHILFTNEETIDFKTFESVLVRFVDDKPDSLYAFLEFVTMEETAPIKITYQVQDINNNTVFQNGTEGNLKKWYNQAFLPIDIKALKPGLNRIVINYEFLSKSHTTDTKIYVNWGEKQVQQANLKLSIEHLKVVANPGDVKKIQKAKASERDSLLAGYWKERDPTPGTDKNELYDEFYSRIQDANKLFHFSKRDGWNTDRGRIYIKYGPPEEILRDIQGTEAFARYEIWYYHQLRRQFIFYDRLGSGEFRLLSQNYGD